jgi:hypothetical protein
MKNLHILPTDKPSRLHFTEFEEELVFTPKYEKLDGANIYITSDEEIKNGTWVIQKDTNKVVFLAFARFETYNKNKDSRESFIKIILTTDQDLIGVQAIDDEFLEWFVKNQSCESVKVEGHIYKGQDETEYKIIIPSEEPKQETTLEEAAERIISDMGWVWENTESSARMVARHCAKSQERSYSEEDMKSAFKVGFSIGYGSDVHAIDEKNRTCDEWFRTI